jgi:hypothetical protein
MFIRRKPNKTGTTSVQAVEKRNGQYKVLRSFSVGRTEQELTGLEEQARGFIEEKNGFIGRLFEDKNDALLCDFVASLSNSQVQVIGPELIFGALYDTTGYNAIPGEMFRHLAVSRLFSLKTIDCLYRYQGIAYSSDTIYRFLDTLCLKQKEEKQPKEKKNKETKPSIKALAEQISFNHTQRVLKGKICVAFYDMTTLYFEASDEDDLRRTGFSKDGKHQCPQIFLGLPVASGGNPTGYGIFEGNIFEGHTFIPVLQNIEKKYSPGKPIVVADSGLLSNKNREVLTNSGYKYILGARVKNMEENIKQQILSFFLKDGEDKTVKLKDKTRLVVTMSDRNRIEGHICICFTAYTILLEMERMLKQAKSEITVKRAQELTKNMYRLSFWLPNSRIEKSQILKMDSEQQLLYQMVVRWVAKNK